MSIEILSVWITKTVMAARRANIELYRNLLKELRSIYRKDKFWEAAAYQYVRKQFRDHSVTSERLCRNKIDMEYLGSTYVYYLKSQTQYNDLLAKYKGVGERSVESTATMLGFGLPEKFDPDSGEKK